jgi:integrase/recombinase XerD
MPTLTEALRTYLQIERRPLTIKQYRLVLTTLITQLGAARQVNRVSFEDLIDVQAGLRSKLSASTVANYTSIYKAFFAWCAQRGYCDQSPAADLVRRRPRPRSDRAIPADELRAMVDYARVTSSRDYAILMFLADTGCRVGGLISLQCANLSLDAGVALLTEKGGMLHRALFSPATADALRRWLSHRPAVDHDYVFIGRGPGHPLTRGAINSLFKSLCRKCHLSRIWTPHAIRHAVGHAYAKAGVPATITQKKLGHADVATTLSYYYPTSDSYLDLVSARLSLSALKSDEELQAPAAKITDLDRKRA